MPELCSPVWMLSLKRSSLSSPIMTSLKGKTSPYKITSVAWPGVCHGQTSPARAKNEGPRFWTITTFGIRGHCARSSVQVSHRRSARLLTASINIHDLHLLYAEELYYSLGHAAFIFSQILAYTISNFEGWTSVSTDICRIPAGTGRRCHFFKPYLVIKAGRLLEFMK